jgi:hypothetical protein
MTVELLEIDNDDRNNSISVEMNCYNYAWITISGDNLVRYYLEPNIDGFKKAQAISDALQEWIRHTKTVIEITKE